MPHKAAFHRGLHCLLRQKQSSGTEMHHNLEISTCDPLKYKMGISILVLSTCMAKFIGMKRVKIFIGLHWYDFLISFYFHSMFIFVIACNIFLFRSLIFCMLCNFSCSCCRLLTLFKINFFKKFFHEHYQSVKQFGSRSGPTFCRS